MLAGCGGSQVLRVPQAQQSTARMLAEARSENLLYLSDGSFGNVYVFAYPDGKVVGEFTGLKEPQGVCSDVAGNVYVVLAGSATIEEFAHGGSTPLRTLADPAGTPLGCAVDPSSGDLAVVNTSGLSGGAPNVAIYRHARGKPAGYSTTAAALYFCSFDDAGNLFVDGASASGSGELFELSKGAKELSTIVVNGSLDPTGGVQWNGNALDVGDRSGGSGHASVYALAIDHGKARVLRATPLDGDNDIESFWIQGRQIAGGNLVEGTLAYWNYPRGGNSTKSFSGFSDPVAMTVSLARKPTTREDRKSWILPEAKDEDLVYADTANTPDTYVFAYPSGKLVGKLVDNVSNQGAVCSDAHGNVFITGIQNDGLGLIYEYAHGSTLPLVVWQENGVWPDGCGVDPSGGNLAVAAWNWASGVSGVNVYRMPATVPAYYEDAEIIDYAFCGYDDKGNLFVNGQGSGPQMYFAEIPKGASGFTNLHFNKYVDYADMGQIQWDGRHVTLEDSSNRAIYRIRISGSNADAIGTTRLKEWNPSSVVLSWIANGMVLAPTGSNDSQIGFWKYPAGGNPIQTIKGPQGLYSVTFSPAK